MSSHSIDEFQAAMIERPDDVGVIQAQADFLQEQGDPRGEILATACANGMNFEQGNLSLDQSRLRLACQRIMRGDVPLNLEQLEATLRLQFTKQVELLKSLNLLEESEEGHFITAIDGKQYPLPDFDEILAKMQKPEMQTKLGQGFDTLLLVPFGLDLERFIDAWRVGLRRNQPRVEALATLNHIHPIWVWHNYRTQPFVYGPHNFTAEHGGRTKVEILDQGGQGLEVQLVEGALENLPLTGRGKEIGGRWQIECGRTPAQYLTELETRGEIGLAPEAYSMQFLDALERKGQVLDTKTFSYLIGAYLPTSCGVPTAYWLPNFGRAYLDWRDLPYHGADRGVRAVVRVL